jgi:predicted transcriptional regulator
MAKNARKQATTVRLDPAVKDRLNKLSALTDQSINDLTNEALREFIQNRSLELEKALEATLENVRAVRKSDPGFKRGIAAFAKAEAALKHDPAEGKIITESTPAQKKVRGMPDE